MKNELLEQLAEILEEDIVNETDELIGFDEWDSLTSLSIIALADSDYNTKITNNDIKSFVRIKDIVDFIANNAK